MKINVFCRPEKELSYDKSFKLDSTSRRNVLFCSAEYALVNFTIQIRQS